jgi:hypothetical protein
MRKSVRKFLVVATFSFLTPSLVTETLAADLPVVTLIATGGNDRNEDRPGEQCTRSGD